MMIFHSYVTVYQSVILLIHCDSLLLQNLDLDRWFHVTCWSFRVSHTEECQLSSCNERLLRHDFLNMPIHVQVGNTSSLSANEDISQEVWMLNSADDKDAALVEALQLYGGPGQRILVFVAMKKQCDVKTSSVSLCRIEKERRSWKAKGALRSE